MPKLHVLPDLSCRLIIIAFCLLAWFFNVAYASRLSVTAKLLLLLIPKARSLSQKALLGFAVTFAYFLGKKFFFKLW